MPGERESIEDMGLTPSGSESAQSRRGPEAAGSEDDASIYAPAAGAAEAPVAEKRSGKALASLICGIVSILVFGVILGPVAVVLGFVARSEIAKEPHLTGSGLALAGIITGIVGFVAAIVILILVGPSLIPGGGD